jgi:hypothetical protein
MYNAIVYSIFVHFSSKQVQKIAFQLEVSSLESKYWFVVFFTRLEGLESPYRDLFKETQVLVVADLLQCY